MSKLSNPQPQADGNAMAMPWQCYGNALAKGWQTNSNCSFAKQRTLRAGDPNGQPGSDAWLERLFTDSGLVELRHLSAAAWQFGAFDDPEAMRRAIKARSDTGALFTTLNRLDPSAVNVRNLLSRKRDGHSAVRDNDISAITRIPLDFDPERPAGTNATDGELMAAIECRDAVVSALMAAGWPEPVTAVSGNGAHAIFRTEITDSDVWQFRDDLYRGIADQFGGLLKANRVKFDATVNNPGRIWRLYGTVNRKGPPSAERPHRTAACRMPAVWERVKPDQILEIVDAWRPNIDDKAAQRRYKTRNGNTPSHTHSQGA